MRTILRVILILNLSLLLTLWVAPGASAQTPAAQPKIRITQVDNSRFPQVTVYVSVTDASGAPVGVDPTAIQVSENDQTMKTVSASGTGQAKGPGQLTTLLLIDVSGSMGTANKLSAAKSAAKAYVDQMRPGDQAGVVAFDTKVNVVQAITADHQALTTAIDALKPGTDTAMFDALANAEQLLAGVNGRKAIVVLTDGMDNRSKNNENAVIQAIGPGGLTISTIGLGNPQDVGNLKGIDETVLKSLAQKAGGIYSFAPDPSSLASIYQQYGSALQSEYALTYTSPSTLRDGVNRALTVTLNGGAVTAVSQYNPGGVLPEVASRSWPLFGGILLGLLVLLFIPMLVGKGMQGIGLGRKKSRVKIVGQPVGAQARGRVKMK